MASRSWQPLTDHDIARVRSIARRLPAASPELIARLREYLAPVNSEEGKAAA